MATVKTSDNNPFKGVPGRPGEIGPKGDKGDPGDPGKKGDQGDPGKDSIVPGPKGDKGDPGDPGKKGDQGDPGKDSIVPGPKGEKGDKGDTGEKGEPGKDSTVAGPKGSKGDKGDPGEKGDKGEDSTVPGPKGDSGKDAPFSTWVTTGEISASTNRENPTNIIYEHKLDKQSACGVSVLLAAKGSNETNFFYGKKHALFYKDTKRVHKIDTDFSEFVPRRSNPQLDFQMKETLDSIQIIAIGVAEEEILWKGEIKIASV